jgi:hypothetical protein
MNIPQFRATLWAMRRRESERQLRIMQAVFQAAAACVSGKIEGFSKEVDRLFAEASGNLAKAKKHKPSAFKSLFETAKKDMAARGEPIPSIL